MVSDCLEDATDVSRDYSDTASSSIKHLAFSSENCSSVHLKGTNPDDDIVEELKVAFEDFENARMKVRPSAMREVWVIMLSGKQLWLIYVSVPRFNIP
jgi:SpoVK/Ycf46/Vps4 family AAA+-type ATPase